ncbi:hypothetical protein SAMN05216184_101821 [Georgenia satyanarayanai]|uniref:Uncharacterized protein n=1 Tax=Georgenia satyanarayanai TaxID=860221 RepID=A0A2Y8ZYX6_9MICO|nr:hypothetical protein [Georgenia satyanarayanai]PYG02348.1 hypothetical protein A8987_101821 [Georgenia satyanarayanai]SSA37225.1 hypothetical protein SAMN05216184_101821 [Georgenia satyanarayanai]
MDDDDQPTSDDNRLAIGVALGVPVGVVLSLLLDNWAFIGVGIALGAAFGAVPANGWSTGEDDPAEPDESRD